VRFNDHYAPSLPRWRWRHNLGHLKGDEAAYAFIHRILQRCPEARFKTANGRFEIRKKSESSLN
jgi:hypothetical protein